MSLKQKTLSGLFWTGIQQFGASGITFIVQIILARIISPSEFGLLGMILIFYAIGIALVDSGMSQSLIRSDNIDNEDYSSVFYMNLIIAIFIYIVLYFSAPFIADFYNQPRLINLIRVFCISILINAFSTIQITKLTKELNFKLQMMVHLPSIVIGGIAGVILAKKGYGVWALVYMELIKTVIASLQYWIRTKWRPQLSFNKEKWMYHFNYGYKLLFAGLIETIFSNIYPMIIGKFYAPAQVGYYTRAASMKNYPVSTIIGALGKVIFPVLAEVKNDNDRLKKVYKKLIQSVMFIIAPLMIVLILMAKPLFVFLLTEKWLSAVPYFQLLCIIGVLQPVNIYNLNVLKVKGRSDLVFKAQVFKKIILSIILAITISMGIKAIIIGQIISSFLGVFINQYFCSKFIEYSIWEQTKDVFKIIFPAIIAGVTTYFIHFFVINKLNSNIVLIISNLFIFGILYIAIQYSLNKEIFNEFVNLLNKVKSRVFNM